MLTEEEVRDLRAIKDAWPQVQAALKMGTSDRPTRDGHAHRDNVIREQGSGAPTHVAKQGTLYWDSVNTSMYVNSTGGATWVEQASGGAAGTHTMAGDTHTDTANVLANNGDLLQIQTGIWVPRAASSHGNHPATYTDANARAAAKYAIYIPLGSDTLGETAPP